jgi:hypothetical protein
MALAHGRVAQVMKQGDTLTPRRRCRMSGHLLWLPESARSLLL